MINAPVAPPASKDPLGILGPPKKEASNNDPLGILGSPKQAPVAPESTTQNESVQGPVFGGRPQPTDFNALFNQAVGLAQIRLPATIQAHQRQAIRGMNQQDIFTAVRDVQATLRPQNTEAGDRPQIKQVTPFDDLWNGPNGGFVQLPPDVEQRRQDVLSNLANPLAGNMAQIQQKLDNGDPLEHARLIQQIKRDNPSLAPQIDKDAYLLSAKDRGANAQKILDNANAIQNGDMVFDHRTGELVKPLGPWGSLAHGWHEMVEARNGYDQLADGTPEENIAKLEAWRAQKDPDKAREVATGWNSIPEMVGRNALPMVGSAVVDLGATALDNPEVAPFINAAIWGKSSHDETFYNSYRQTYDHLRNQGISQLDAEREARGQAEFDSNIDAANAAFMSMAAGQASKLGKPSELLNRGSGQMVYDEAGNLLRREAPIDPAYQKVLNKIYANTLGDKTTNIGKRILQEGGPVAAMTGASQVAKNVYDNKPWDQDVLSATLGQLGLHASLAILGNAGNIIPGVKKENLADEVNPDTEDGAKLFIKEPNEPTLSPSDPFNKAEKAYKGRFPSEDIGGEQLNNKLRDIAEKGHDPATSEQAKAIYGQNLVDAAKELHPAESFNTKEPDITKPLEEQITPDMTTGEISSLKNKYTAQARNALGMPEVEEPARKEFGTSWDEAKQGIANGTINPENLVAEALKKARPWSDVENAAVLHHQVDKETQLKGVETKINELGPDGDSQQLSDLNTQRAQLRDQLQDIYTAGKRAGTENARGLAIRKMLADQNYSLASMMDQKQAAQNGALLTDAQKADVESQYNDIQDAKEQRDKMTAAGFTADPNASVSGNAKVQRAQLAFNKSLAQPKTGMTKYGDAFVNWQREFKLSNPLTLGKLAMAGIARTGLSPVEQLFGGAISKAPESSWLGKVAQKATSEVGFNAKNEADALTSGFMKGIQDMGDIWKTGKSDLDFIGGGKQMDEDGINFFGKLHKIIKAPVKRVAFERSWRNQVSNLLEQGQNPTDPAIMAQTSIQAMKDANRAIFMQDNKVSQGMNNLVNYFNRGGTAGKLSADALKFLVPFVKVPTNIVGETANYLSGGLPGWGTLIYKGLTKGLDDMSPEQASFITRNIKKGSLGAAVMGYAFFHPDDFGGLYRPGVKPDDEDLKEGQFKFMGMTVPKWASEAPIVQAAQVAATLRKYMEGHKEDESDLPDDVLATSAALLFEEPLMAPIKQWSQLAGNKSERAKAVGQLAKGTVDPAILQQIARWQQGDAQLKPQGSLLETTGQSIESGLPYLWHNVPEKEQK